MSWTVSPFINGLWYELRTAKGSKAMPGVVIMDPSGKPGYPKVITGDPHTPPYVHAVMCPSSPWWREELAAIGQRIQKELGANMVYLDITANTSPLPCFARSHPHPPGRGQWWVEELRRQIKAIKSAKDSVPYVQSECFNEALGGSLDTNLIWTDRYPWEAPLLGAVYGGWLDYYGSRVYEGEDLTTFTVKLTRDVFWGGAIGAVINNWWAGSNESAYARTIITLTKFRRVAKDYLVYGEMVRPPTMVSAPLWIKLPGWQCEYRRPIGEFEMEAIERVAWRSPSGKLGLALMNYAEKPYLAEFDLGTVAGLKVAGAPEAIVCEGTQAPVVNVQGKELKIDLLPGAPALVVLGRV